jgi:glutaredoxin
VTEITIVTTADCAFCEQAKQVLARVGADAPLVVRDVPLDSREGRRITARVAAPFPPVVLLDGEAFSYGRLSERRLRKALAGQVSKAP